MARGTFANYLSSLSLRARTLLMLPLSKVAAPLRTLRCAGAPARPPNSFGPLREGISDAEATNHSEPTHENCLTANLQILLRKAIGMMPGPRYLTISSTGALGRLVLP